MGPTAISTNLSISQWAESQLERNKSFKLLHLYRDADILWAEVITSEAQSVYHLCLYYQSN